MKQENFFEKKIGDDIIAYLEVNDVRKAQKYAEKYVEMCTMIINNLNNVITVMNTHMALILEGIEHMKIVTEEGESFEDYKKDIARAIRSSCEAHIMERMIISFKNLSTTTARMKLD